MDMGTSGLDWIVILKIHFGRIFFVVGLVLSEGLLGASVASSVVVLARLPACLLANQAPCQHSLNGGPTFFNLNF